MSAFKRKSKKSKAERAAARAAAGQALKRGMATCAATLVFGGLAVGVLFGVPRLQAGLAQKALGEPVRVVFDWPAAAGKDAQAGATWLPRDVQDQLTAAAIRAIGQHPDPFSVEGLRHVAEITASSGWFEQIDAVKREPGGVVRISGQWRTPVAVVRQNDKDYLVSRKGEVLPLAFDQGGSTLKAILGAQLDPVRVNGQIVHGTVWPGGDIRAGLDLLATVASRPWAAQVQAVDVSNYTAKKQLALITKTHGRVAWGAGVEEAIPGQVSTEVKLKRLDYIQAQFGAIDARHRIVEVAGPKVLVDDTATASAQ